MTVPHRRWDTDERGRGVADGGWIAPDVRRLLDTLAEPGWVAEDPDIHLLPHLRRACQEAGSPWTLAGTAFDGGVYTVDLEWVRREPRLGRLRSDALALVGSVAEGVTFVEQRVGQGRIEFRAVTGILEGDGLFKGHGHLLLLRRDVLPLIDVRTLTSRPPAGREISRCCSSPS